VLQPKIASETNKKIQPLSSIGKFEYQDKLVIFTTSTNQLCAYALKTMFMKPRNMEHNEKFTINCPKGPITDLKIVDQRFFSCGSENDTLVELDKNDGLVKISYTGFINAEKRPTRITVIKSQSEESKELIAVPDGKSVKIWQIDDNQLALKVIPNDTTHPVVSGLDSNSNGKLLAIYYENTNFVDFYSVTSNAPERVAQSDKKRKRNSSPSSQRKSSKLDQQKSDSDVEDIEVDKELEADRLETENLVSIFFSISL